MDPTQILAWVGVAAIVYLAVRLIAWFAKKHGDEPYEF
jgi:hypothetical protein